jgi:hypothetical protein
VVLPPSPSRRSLILLIANIYIRPKGEHALSLVDDLTFQALERMKHSGFTPALIVETSPDNFQRIDSHYVTSLLLAKKISKKVDIMILCGRLGILPRKVVMP